MIYSALRGPRATRWSLVALVCATTLIQPYLWLFVRRPPSRCALRRRYSSGTTTWQTGGYRSRKTTFAGSLRAARTRRCLLVGIRDRNRGIRPQPGEPSDPDRRQQSLAEFSPLHSSHPAGGLTVVEPASLARRTRLQHVLEQFSLAAPRTARHRRCVLGRDGLCSGTRAVARTGDGGQSPARS